MSFTQTPSFLLQQPAAPAAAAPMPALFVSHGSPQFARDVGTSGPALTAWGQRLRQAHPGLKGVVMMSPHWMSRVPQVMSGAQPATWHDFGGFEEALYQLRYPAPGHPGLARQVLDGLAGAGITAQADAQRPFDHGAWVPLMHLLPAADVPVVQLSLPVGWSPRQLHALGHALAPLANEGVLLAGSGSMTHNLGEFFGGQRSAAAYVVEFSRWVEMHVMGQGDALFEVLQRAPHARRAHPSDEHFLPLFFALGAAGWGLGRALNVEWITREVMYGMLAMDSFALTPARA
jgi:4,5-DOPA dioxygenase extradiol